MLTIRAEQLQALRADAERRFAEEMREHVRQHFPEQTAALAGDALHARVQDGIARAREHGLTSRRGICQYLDLVMLYGPDFDTAPEHAWARELLQDAEVPDPEERMSRLHSEAERRQALAARNAQVRAAFKKGGK